MLSISTCMVHKVVSIIALPAIQSNLTEKPEDAMGKIDFIQVTKQDIWSLCIGDSEKLRLRSLHLFFTLWIRTVSNMFVYNCYAHTQTYTYRDHPYTQTVRERDTLIFIIHHRNTEYFCERWTRTYARNRFAMDQNEIAWMKYTTKYLLACTKHETYWRHTYNQNTQHDIQPKTECEKRSQRNDSVNERSQKQHTI